MGRVGGGRGLSKLLNKLLFGQVDIGTSWSWWKELLMGCVGNGTRLSLDKYIVG